jgi:hypothetical protein
MRGSFVREQAAAAAVDVPLRAALERSALLECAASDVVPFQGEAESVAIEP